MFEQRLYLSSIGLIEFVFVYPPNKDVIHNPLPDDVESRILSFVSICFFLIHYHGNPTNFIDLVNKKGQFSTELIRIGHTYFIKLDYFIE